jgi:hypothetical protein
MEANGSLVIEGSANDTVLSGVAAATDGGQLGANMKGVLRFNNGFKVQWDCIEVAANSTVTVTFPEAFTEDVYFIHVQLATIPGAAAQQADVAGFLRAVDTLSTGSVRSQDDVAKDVSYFVVGKDTV